jgi:hypothetical protein
LLLILTLFPVPALSLLSGWFLTGSGGSAFVATDCAGIGLGALAAYWQAFGMTSTAVRSNFFQSFDITEDFTF